MKRALCALALLAGACGGDDDDAGQTGPDAGELSPDAATCGIAPGGACADQTLQTCVGGELQTQDCRATMATCRFDSAAGAAACIDECAAASVDAAGTCVDRSVRRCEVVDGRNTVVSDTCGAGETCAPAGQPAACIGDPCRDLGPQGKCDGNTLLRCVGGAPSPTDCAGTSQVCAYVDNTAGYACVAPAATGAMVVTGTVRYEDRAPLNDGALGAITAMDVRGALITVVTDADSMVVATALTSDDGSYTLRYDAAVGTMVHVMVTAHSPLPARPVRVLRNQTQLHGFGGASFAAAASTTQDLLVTDASAASEAFNILDQSVLAMDTIRTAMGNPTPTPLTARWSRGSNQGTYYSNRTIFLLGSTSDDDGYDDTVILHEIGHFVEDTEGRSDSPGGGHDGSPTDPTLAWSEGFATYFAMATRGAPYYMDSNSGGGWGYDADTSLTRAQAAGALDQNVSEDMVSQILWDLGDGGSNDDDPLSSSMHATLLRIQPSYLARVMLRSVGADGVDLVDFLDGWFLRGGLSTCAGVRSVVSTTRTFPYDYAGPGGRCP